MLPLVAGLLGSSSAGALVRTREGEWRVGEPVRTVMFDGDDHELWRVLFSRRTRAEIERLTPDAEVVEGWAVFGPRAG